MELSIGLGKYILEGSFNLLHGELSLELAKTYWTAPISIWFQSPSRRAVIGTQKRILGKWGKSERFQSPSRRAVIGTPGTIREREMVRVSFNLLHGELSLEPIPIRYMVCTTGKFQSPSRRAVIGTHAPTNNGGNIAVSISFTESCHWNYLYPGSIDPGSGSFNLLHGELSLELL